MALSRYGTGTNSLSLFLYRVTGGGTLGFEAFRVFSRFVTVPEDSSDIDLHTDSAYLFVLFELGSGVAAVFWLGTGAVERT